MNKPPPLLQQLSPREMEELQVALELVSSTASLLYLTPCVTCYPTLTPGERGKQLMGMKVKEMGMGITRNAFCYT